MSLIKSVLFGSEGSYAIFGIQVKFEQGKPEDTSSLNLAKVDFISKAVIKCSNSNIFFWITQGYAHVFVHEMSHALSLKLLTNIHITILIFKSSCTGVTLTSAETLTDWEDTIVNVAGPMGNIAFCTIKLVAATALKSYLSWPIALVLGIGSVTWILEELLYAYTSASNRDSGDFGYIARKGNTHFALASLALVSQVALGIFAAVRFAV